ncbi:MAG: N-(5'-phosphoribosyl)anthranilate isomerase, partial [Rhizobiales bacterium]|nr:N-(5'-phosphoribosyl)anthranilate isomerase [Hyphomicrobiales bacterium]
LDPGRPVMLSGGLDPDNVPQALARIQVDGVDVSSGVESAPGVKSPEKIAAFVQAARAASGRGSA